MYREVALNCFRYLDFKSFAEVDRLSIPEYNLLMEAVNLKQFDLTHRNYLQAWLTFAAKAMKKRRPVYNKFSKFFNYEKELAKVTNKDNENSRFSGIGKLLKK